VRKLWVVATAVLLLVPVVGGGEETVKAYRAKVWTNDGDLYVLQDLKDRGVSGRWHYWAPGEEGELSWDLVDYVVFLDNEKPWAPGPGHAARRDKPRARRAEVYFNSGDVRELWLYIDVLYGKDHYGKRKVYGNDVTQIDFLTTYHETVQRCPNGHTWKEPGYRFCPLDGQRLVETPQY
jgi:hypothetical protein